MTIPTGPASMHVTKGWHLLSRVFLTGRRLEWDLPAMAGLPACGHYPCGIHLIVLQSDVQELELLLKGNQAAVLTLIEFNRICTVLLRLNQLDLHQLAFT